MSRRWSPKRLFCFTWQPYAVELQKDYSTETPTLVEFGLEKTPTGTLLGVTESGFDKIRRERHVDALRMNDRGWVEQMKNIEAHVSETP